MSTLAKLAGISAVLAPAICFSAHQPKVAVACADTQPAIIDTQPSVLPVVQDVTVSGFEFRNNTHFSKNRLQAVVDEALKKIAPRWPQDKRLSLDDLEEARLALSHFYVDNGYITSGATIPEQPFDGGVVVFEIEEGRISDVNVTFRDGKGPINRHLLRQGYVISRLRLASRPPMNIVRLKDELEILRQDPNIKAINAELKPLATPGEGTLDVQVEEANPFQLGFQFSNRRPPSVGSTALDLIASDSDVAGFGDALSVRYDVLNGAIDDMRFGGDKDFFLSYTIPVTPADTTFSIDFSRTNTLVEEQNFQQLNIASESDSLSFTTRQPLYRKPTADVAEPGNFAWPSIEFDVFLTGSLRENKTDLLGQPFDFTSGDQNGGEHVTAIRFGQELTVRNERDAFSGRSTFNLGVPWFDSTPRIKSGRPGGRFFDWLGQAQFVHLIADTDVQFVVRGTAQLSDRPLLTLEQFALGGVDTVRGYPENFLIRDSAVVGTVELRVPVFKKNDFEISLIPFFDAGYGWNRTHSARHAETLDSVGIGLSVNATRHIAAQIYYGAALQRHATDSRDVENLGVHFNLLFLVF